MNKILICQIEELLKCEDKLAALCNVSAALNQTIGRINWIGFYLYKNGKLVLGPFQGKPACTMIDVGKGVCGTSFEKRMLLNVEDVSRFEGHIACDPDSCSELVVPLIYEGKTYGVLDCDSPFLSRFTANEEEIFEEVAKLVAKKIAEK